MSGNGETVNGETGNGAGDSGDGGAVGDVRNKNDLNSEKTSERDRALVPEAATQRIRVGFSAINFDGYFRTSNLKNGEYLQTHLHNVEEVRKPMEDTIIYGRCIPEMNVKKEEYRMELTLDSERNLTSGYCTCDCGISGKCKHACALAIFVNEERSESKTDREQTWHKPGTAGATMYRKGKTIEELYKIQNLNFPNFNNNNGEKEESLNNWLQILEKRGQTQSSFYKMKKSELLDSREEDPSSSLEVSDVDPRLNCLFSRNTRPVNVYFKKSYEDGRIGFLKWVKTMNDDETRFYKNEVEVSEQTAKDIFCQTLSQSKSPRWFKERKLRISSTKARGIWKAKKDETRRKYFNYNSHHINHKNLRYGIELEDEAFNEYIKITGNEVLKSGLVVRCDQPFLCGSPDGLIFSPTSSSPKLWLLEIKCPSSMENEEEIQMDYIENGKLKESHTYYSQIQLNMYCCDIDFCHLFLYSRKDHKIIEVHRNQDFI